MLNSPCLAIEQTHRSECDCNKPLHPERNVRCMSKPTTLPMFVSGPRFPFQALILKSSSALV